VETERVAAIASVAGTVGSALREATAVLAGARAVASAPREAAELLSALLEQPRSWPVLHRDELLDEVTRAALLAAAVRRASGAPLAYAVGRAAFRHLTLEVDERVLIPRPETEVLVDLVLARAAEGGVAVDVGTGSGCIALALASEGRFARVVGTDVSLDALAVARRNVERCAASLRSPVEMRHGSLLDPMRGERAHVVVSNPPYIASDESPSLPRDVRDWEPPVALYSSGRGMAVTTALVHQASDVLEDQGLLAIEVDCRRAALVAECVASDGRYIDVSVMLDLTGRERFVLARRMY
jgi:release factor glutamine methyltransferase